MDGVLELPPSRASVFSRPSTYESWIPHGLPQLPEDVIILDWREVASGTHGTIRRAMIQQDGVEKVVCLKLFTEECAEEYDREAYAYEMLIHRQVKRCIPEVYWKGSFPLSRWNGDIGSNNENDDIYHGLVMEYFDDFKELDFSRIDIATAEAVGLALIKIHEARTVHGDLAERNILLVREAGAVRPVWVDFSCADVNVFPLLLNAEWGGFIVELRKNMVIHIMATINRLRTLLFSPTKDSPISERCMKTATATTDNLRLSKIRTLQTLILPSIWYSLLLFLHTFE
jgi:hypothetical protein